MQKLQVNVEEVSREVISQNKVLTKYRSGNKEIRVKSSFISNGEDLDDIFLRIISMKIEERQGDKI